MYKYKKNQTRVKKIRKERGRSSRRRRSSFAGVEKLGFLCSTHDIFLNAVVRHMLKATE